MYSNSYLHHPRDIPILLEPLQFVLWNILVIVVVVCIVLLRDLTEIDGRWQPEQNLPIYSLE